MSSAWLLPEHIADVLPSEARRIEELRRKLLDLARSYGFELVIPPMLEHLESLLSGAGLGHDLKTFKLVDQLSGRMLGVRADTTPQVARIDAHLLNRQGVARLCYCGPVLHARPDRPLATREPLQFGAEIYGHAGLEADLEVQDLGVGFEPRMAVDLGAELQRLARRVRAVGPGVDHRTAVAQPRYACAIEQVGIDARDLWRGVGAQTHAASRQLVDQLEGLQVERFAGTGQEGFEMLEQRRHHQLVAIATGGVEQLASKFFDVARLGRQHIGNVIREDPGGHGDRGRG